MAVIELGLVTGDDSTPAPGRSWRPRISRLGAATLLLAGVLTTTNGSAPPDSHAPVPLWSIPLEGGGESFTVDSDNVYVLGAFGQRRLTAHDPRTGSARWSVPAPDAAWVGSPVNGVFLLPVATADGSPDAGRDTIAIDTRTGRQLWRQPGEYAAAHGDQILLARWNDEAGTPLSLRVVGLRDGVLLWSRPGTGLQTWVTPESGTSDRLVTATPGGWIEVRRFQDGRLLTSGQVPWSRRGAEDQTTELSVAGRVLVVRNVVSDRATVTAYDTETLRPRWRLDSVTFSGLYGCGPVLCLNDSHGLSGHDPDTGELRWRRDTSGYAFPLRPDRLVVDDDADGSTHTLVDSRTGATVAGLGGGLTIGTDAEPGRAYVLTRTRQPAGQTAVAHLDEDTGELHTRGVIPLIPDFGCRALAELLVCATPEATLVTTDLRGGG